MSAHPEADPRGAAPAAPTGRAFEFETADGRRLGATLFGAEARPGRAVLIQSATGVKQGYYAKFAAWLAARGFAVMTFDYRGIGRSRPASLRGDAATMRDWAERDIPAAWDALEAAVPGARLLAIGHSFGGQTFGLLPRPERLAAVLAVGAQSGYWRHWRGLGRLGMWVFTHVAIPVVTPLHGYAAASRLGLGEDLPGGVALEWVRWCRHPEYIVGALGAHARYAQVRTPLRVVAATDDAYAPERAVRGLMALYPNAAAELRRVSPAELGQRAIGHFGYFREAFRDTLWRESADWLEAQCRS